MKWIVSLALALTFIAGPVRAQTPDQIQQALEHARAIEALLVPTSTVVDLQAALNAATCGQTILLAPTAVYTGRFEMSKPCTSPITLTTAAALPGRRVTPADAPLLPKIKASAGQPSAIVMSGSGYVLRGLEITGGSNVVDVSGANIVIDQSYIHGAPNEDHVRGIAMNGTNVSVTRSSVLDFHSAAGQDSQGICVWNGTNLLIEDNDIEAASENILFGGADPTTPGLVPSNITIRGNLLTKPLAWKAIRGWNVKNLLEFKNAAHVTATSNLLENNWSDAQAGYPLVLTVRDQDGACPQCTVQDVTFSGNVVRHVGAFANILAVDNEIHPGQTKPYPSTRAGGITITGNLVYDVDTVAWRAAWSGGADGRMFMVSDGVNGLTIDHNTFLGQTFNSLLTFQNGAFPLVGFVYTNNVSAAGTYSVVGAGDLNGQGPAILAHYAPGAVWTANGVIGGGSYPDGTTLGVTMNADMTAAGFQGGADIGALKAAIAGLDLVK